MSLRTQNSGHYRTQADAARRLTGFILLLIGIALMVALYYVKTRAQSARAEARNLAYQITVEESAISVLRAEIAHLENPERLNDLGAEHLSLAPISTDQMIAVDDIAARFPLREPAKPGAAGGTNNRAGVARD